MDKKQKPSQEKPAFRKFLVGDFSQHLQIPPAIIKNFNGKSLCKCTLRDPSGKCWSVKLENREDGLFFHNGWQGFVEDHFLEFGDVLVFEYDGRSKFDVTIYDKTCCEKEVRVEIANGGGSDTGNLEIVAHKTSGDNVMPRKGRTIDHSEETPTESISFESDNTYFITHLKKFRRHGMMVPKDVAIAEGLMSPEGLLNKETVMLQDSSGTSRLAKLNVRGDGRLLMGKGWTSCLSENQISVGDTIAFEFVKQGVIQVHVFRANSSSVVVAGDDFVRRGRPKLDHVEETCSTKSILFESENTCFIKPLKKYATCSMLIPKDVAIAEGLVSFDGRRHKKTVILQDSTGTTSWRAQLHVTDDGRLLMKKGWETCRKANRISIGDTIVFEFVKQGVMQLHVFRDKRCSVALAGPQALIAKIKAR